MYLEALQAIKINPGHDPSEILNITEINGLVSDYRLCGLTLDEAATALSVGLEISLLEAQNIVRAHADWQDIVSRIPN